MEEVIDLKQLVTAFWEKKIHVIIIIVIFAIIGMIYTTFMVTPKYKSSTTLVLATTTGDSDENQANSITQTDVTLNQKLVSTYSELIKSNSILRQVINNLEISSIKEEELRKNVTVTAVKDTELIDITVTNENSKYTAAITNEIAKVFTEKVAEIYNINNVHIVDEAEVSNEPYNIDHKKDIAIFVAIGIIISVAYVVITDIFDTTIKTTEDIEKNTGLLVLAEIPAYNFETKTGGNA